MSTLDRTRSWRSVKGHDGRPEGNSRFPHPSLGRISGPLLDRIDLQIEVPAVPSQEMCSKDGGAGSSEILFRGLFHRELTTE
jgi:predicted ATPase with chaperone activity